MDWGLYLRPCIRRNFPNFLFSQVLEMFGCRSLKFFWKKWNFWTRKILAKKIGKKFGNLSLEKSLDINQNCSQFWKFQKNYVKFEFLVKKPCFGWKSLKKVCEKFEKSSEISKIVLFRTFRKLRKNDFKLELRKSQKTRSD